MVAARRGRGSARRTRRSPRPTPRPRSGRRGASAWASRSAEHVLVEQPSLLVRVAAAAEADDVPLHRHVASFTRSGHNVPSASIVAMASPSQLKVGDRSYEIFRLDALQATYDIARLPYTLRVLLENVLRNGDEADVEAVARWDAKAEPSNEISFAPSRVLLQDFTGVPAVVDLAAMRDAMAELGGDPAKIDPLVPAELVIDHSVQVDESGSRRRLRPQHRARVRAQPRALLFLRWGQGVFGASASCRPARASAPGEPRVPRARRRGPRRRRVPGHARRHRLAHDDGQRARRARLGRRRHRGRGRDARPAAVDARAAGRRLQAQRRAVAKARPRPTSCSR